MIHKDVALASFLPNSNIYIDAIEKKYLSISLFSFLNLTVIIFLLLDLKES